MGLRITAISLFMVLFITGCAMDRGKRWVRDDSDSGVEIPDLECGGDPIDDRGCVRGVDTEILYYCDRQGEFYVIEQRLCHNEDMVCVSNPPYEDCENQVFVPDTEPVGCAVCFPCQLGCHDGNVAECLPDGSDWRIVEICDSAAGETCEQGACVNGCEVADRNFSNVGCEYWAVDLDNAVDNGISAAAQQFAVVVSNPSQNNEAHVTIELCHQQPCSDEANIEVIEEAIVNRRDLEIFELDSREVDGSPPGEYNTGAGTALGPLAYRISSNWPIIAYQFNPLENIDVFSNDASLLLPSSALDGNYSILSWPQTIANTPGVPDINSHDDFGAFLTIVGVEDDTEVTVTTRASIIPSGEDPPIVPFTPVGGELTMTINRFDVLNLETGLYNGEHSFLADFTGSKVRSNKRIAVFSGVEATDVPIWRTRSERLQAADHLEQQQWPERTLGHRFVVGHTPRRTQALRATGAVVSPLSTEPEWFRIMAIEDGTEVTTTIPGEESITLDAMEYVTVESETHFIATSNLPIMVGQFVGGQDTTGILLTYPGGDPAFILIPPSEQWRTGYVFLTPNKYMFDYLIITVSSARVSHVSLDGEEVATMANCWRERADGLPPDEPTLPEYYVITCALSEPVWNPETGKVEPGIQNDVPHEVYVEGEDPQNRGIGITVYGFDNYVSYGYAGGTDLRIIQ